MNLSDLKRAVWKDERVRELRLNQSEIKILINVTVDHIRKGLLKYGVVKIQDLFTLDVREAKGRKIRNPHTKEHMYSKDYHKVGLKPSKKLADGLKKFKK